jgi:hypothetical protein
LVPSHSIHVVTTGVNSRLFKLGLYTWLVDDRSNGFLLAGQNGMPCIVRFAIPVLVGMLVLSFYGHSDGELGWGNLVVTIKVVSSYYFRHQTFRHKFAYVHEVSASTLWML